MVGGLPRASPLRLKSIGQAWGPEAVLKEMAMQLGLPLYILIDILNNKAKIDRDGNVVLDDDEEGNESEED